MRPMCIGRTRSPKPCSVGWWSVPSREWLVGMGSLRGSSWFSREVSLAIPSHSRSFDLGRGLRPFAPFGRLASRPAPWLRGGARRLRLLPAGHPESRSSRIGRSRLRAPPALAEVVPLPLLAQMSGAGKGLVLAAFRCSCVPSWSTALFLVIARRAARMAWT